MALQLVPKPSDNDEHLKEAAIADGCNPRWYDGILGWAYHCQCDGNEHGFDQQCSVITEKSVARAASRHKVLDKSKSPS